MSDTVPDHSSLTRIRDRLGVECFAVVFEHVVEQCRRAGLVDGKRIITDASLVERMRRRANWRGENSRKK